WDRLAGGQGAAVGTAGRLWRHQPPDARRGRTDRRLADHPARRPGERDRRVVPRLAPARDLPGPPVDRPLRRHRTPAAGVVQREQVPALRLRGSGASVDSTAKNTKIAKGPRQPRAIAITLSLAFLAFLA